MQYFIECPHCKAMIRVGDLVQDYVGCAWFVDGATVDVDCQNCEEIVELMVCVSLTYDVIG